MYKIYRDISNYFIIRKAIKKGMMKPDWTKHKMRVDWVNRIYTVITLTKYDIGDDELVLKAKIVERTKPISDIIHGLGISDLVAVSLEKIPDSDSYLIVYYPIFNYLTVWRVVLFFLSLIGAICVGLWLF